MNSLRLFLGLDSASSSGISSTRGSTQSSTTFKEDAMGQMKYGHTSSIHIKKTSVSNISEIPELKQMVVLTAMERLFDEKHFSICAVRNIAKVIGAPACGPAWDMLEALHCIQYATMPAELRESIPHLVNECLKTKQAMIENTRTALDGVIL